MAKETDTYIAQISPIIERAYRDGFKDGENSMREKLLAVAGAPTGIVTEKDTVLPVTVVRAPRGLPKKLVRKVLKKTPHLKLSEVREAVLRLDNRVSPKTVENILHRGKGNEFNNKGRKWFLIGHAEKETAEVADNERSAVTRYIPTLGGHND